jgi:hypothetical protein
MDHQGRMVAGVVYEDFTDFACSAHIAIARPSPLVRTFLYAAFWYPFTELKLKKMIGYVRSDNEAALKLDEWMGFKREHVITGMYGDADMVIVSMNREDCRWIAQPGAQ